MTKRQGIYGTGRWLAILSVVMVLCLLGTSVVLADGNTGEYMGGTYIKVKDSEGAAVYAGAIKFRLADSDSDGDGVPDSVEAGNDPARPQDSDGDGVPDYVDADDDGDGIPTSVEYNDPTDPDDDVCANVYQDSDGDGIPNCQDNDVDGDGIPNYLDLDSDGDSIPDVDEYDADGNGIPDDMDGDDIPDWLDLAMGLDKAPYPYRLYFVLYIRD